LWVKLSLAFGIPVGQLKRQLTSTEWAEYQAADNLGMIPDWRRQQELMAVAAGIDPAELFGESRPQDMRRVYERRRAMYGRQSRGHI
jgi:hypothetical protein